MQMACVRAPYFTEVLRPRPQRRLCLAFPWPRPSASRSAPAASITACARARARVTVSLAIFSGARVSPPPPSPPLAPRGGARRWALTRLRRSASAACFAPVAWRALRLAASPRTACAASLAIRFSTRPASARITLPRVLNRAPASSRTRRTSPLASTYAWSTADALDSPSFPTPTPRTGAGREASRLSAPLDSLRRILAIAAPHPLRSRPTAHLVPKRYL